MDDFRRLWREFVIGTKSLSYQLNKNGSTPFFAKERDRFVEKIVNPMDAAWLRLQDHERSQLEFEIFPVKW